MDTSEYPVSSDDATEDGHTAVDMDSASVTVVCGSFSSNNVVVV